jgi:hypothetical protein
VAVDALPGAHVAERLQSHDRLGVSSSFVARVIHGVSASSWAGRAQHEADKYGRHRSSSGVGRYRVIERSLSVPATLLIFAISSMPSIESRGGSLRGLPEEWG